MNPVSDSGPWTLGTLIAFPLGLLITLIFVVLAALFFLAARKERDPADELLVAGGAFTVAALFAGGLTTAAMWPLKSEFHQWRTVEGQVERIESRLIADGDGMSERYVVTIADRPFAVDDTRAALLETGDEVSLRCKREWQYAADSGWSCRWGGMTEATR